MNSLVMVDSDHSLAGITRRLTGVTEWTLGDLEDFCEVLGLSSLYITHGVREIAAPDSHISPGQQTNVRRLRRRAARQPVGLLAWGSAVKPTLPAVLYLTPAAA